MSRFKKTLVAIDLDVLDRAAVILGTSTKKDTVNAALREIVRQAAAKDFLTLARSGELGPPEVFS